MTRKRALPAVTESHQPKRAPCFVQNKALGAPECHPNFSRASTGLTDASVFAGTAGFLRSAPEWA